MTIIKFDIYKKIKIYIFLGYSFWKNWFNFYFFRLIVKCLKEIEF